MWLGIALDGDCLLHTLLLGRSALHRKREFCGAGNGAKLCGRRARGRDFFWRTCFAQALGRRVAGVRWRDAGFYRPEIAKFLDFGALCGVEYARVVQVV